MRGRARLFRPKADDPKLLARVFNRGAWLTSSMRYECVTRLNNLELQLIDRPIAEKPEGGSIIGFRTRYRFLLEQRSAPHLTVDPQLDGAFVIRASDAEDRKSVV